MEALSGSRRTTRGGLFLDIFPISFLEPFFARRSAEAIDEWSRFLYLSLKGHTALGQSHHQLHLRHDRAERRALPDGHARRRASLDARKPPTF